MLDFPMLLLCKFWMKSWIRLYFSFHKIQFYTADGIALIFSRSRKIWSIHSWCPSCSFDSHCADVQFIMGIGKKIKKTLKIPPLSSNCHNRLDTCNQGARIFEPITNCFGPESCLCQLGTRSTMKKMSTNVFFSINYINIWSCTVAPKQCLFSKQSSNRARQVWHIHFMRLW